jgi:hypothetical protein
MKTMTCKQMGGPCDTAFQGETADDVIKAQDSHLKEMVAKEDEPHKKAFTMMEERWKDPKSGMEWYTKTKDTFASLPED